MIDLERAVPDPDLSEANRWGAGIVLIHDDDDATRIVLPIEGPWAEWFGYSWHADPQIPEDVAFLVGIDRAGVPFLKVVALAQRSE